MKLLAGIIIGIIIALSVTTTYAQYKYERFSWVAEDMAWVDVLWDDHEKTNCYIANSKAISCVRSMNYEE